MLITLHTHKMPGVHIHGQAVGSDDNINYVDHPQPYSTDPIHSHRSV